MTNRQALNVLKNNHTCKGCPYLNVFDCTFGEKIGCYPEIVLSKALDRLEELEEKLNNKTLIELKYPLDTKIYVVMSVYDFAKHKIVYNVELYHYMDIVMGNLDEDNDYEKWFLTLNEAKDFIRSRENEN